MRRALTVVVVALLTAAVSGVDGMSWATQAQDRARAEAERQEMLDRARALAIGTTIEIELNEGEKVKGRIESIDAESVTVTTAGKQPVVRTIPITAIKSVKKPGHALRNTLIAIGIIVGVCAAITIPLNNDVVDRGVVISAPDRPGQADAR